jgi:hypothetical protein
MQQARSSSQEALQRGEPQLRSYPFLAGVFHFTGKEIMSDPLLVAAEIVSFVTDHDKQSLYETCHAD